MVYLVYVCVCVLAVADQTRSERGINNQQPSATAEALESLSVCVGLFMMGAKKPTTTCTHTQMRIAYHAKFDMYLYLYELLYMCVCCVVDVVCYGACVYMWGYWECITGSVVTCDTSNTEYLSFLFSQTSAEDIQ